MTSLWLAHPEWAPSVAAATAFVAVVVLASWWRARRRSVRLLGTPKWVGVGRLGRDAMVLLALAAIGLAALGLRAGLRSERVPASGVDVVLLLDVSLSMEASDVPPSRLARARRLAAELLARLGPGDRAALAAFAGRGVLLTPLTPDFDALTELAAAVDGTLLAARGSDLDAGVRAALGAFEAASERPRVLVVLADGEDPAGAGDAGSATLARADTRLVAIALGLDSGALVPDGRAPLRDADGRPVRSQRDAARLARWAAASDGASFEADRWGEIDLSAAAAEIRRDAGRNPGDTVLRRVPAVQTGPLAALALVLLWLEWTGVLRPGSAVPWRSVRRSPACGRRRRPHATAALASVFWFGPLAPGVASADREAPQAHHSPTDAARAAAQIEAALRTRPGDGELLVALGLARAEAGDRVGAGHALRAAALTARDPGLAALAWYDLGVLALGDEDLENARDAFFDALALRPDDREARFNLEWTLRALRAEPPPPPPPGASGKADDPEQEDPDAEPPPHGEREQPSPDAANEEETRAGAPDRQRFAPALGETEVEHLLSQVDDAADQALRAAAGPDDEPRPRRGATPAW